LLVRPITMLLPVPTRRSSDLYRSSHRKPFAVPIGQGKLRQYYIARRKSVCIFEKSSYSAYASIDRLISVGRIQRLLENTNRFSSDRKSTRLNSSHVSISYAVF